MDVLVQGAVNSLGYLEEGKFNCEPDCYETMRDIIGYLRKDGSLTSRLECGRQNLVSQALVPIVKLEDLDDNLFDVTIRLLVNLCQPPISSLYGKPPENKEQWQTYHSLEENLMRAKPSFIDVQFFNVLKKKMQEYFIDTSYDEREEGVRLVMERIILLLRYILSIHSTTRDNRRTNSENNTHDRVIASFLDSGIDEVLIHISSDAKEKEFHVAIVDIFAQLLKEHAPESLVSAKKGQSDEEKKKTEDELGKMIENEAVKEAQRKQMMKIRHSRFGGSYVVKGMKAPSSNSDMLVLRPVKTMNQLNFNEQRKDTKRVSKNRRPFEAVQKTHESSVEIRLKLCEMVQKVMEKAFNRLMKSAKQLVFELRAMHRNTQINFFFLMKFVLRFARLIQAPLKQVSICIGIEAFHDTNSRLTEFVESALTLHGKRGGGTVGEIESRATALRAQAVLSAFNELILLHQYALENSATDEKDVAKKAISHILNVEEYRELSSDIIRKYSPGIFSKTFLRELVLTTHNYFRLLEKYVKKGELKTVTKKTKVRRIKKKTKKASVEKDSRAHLDHLKGEELAKLWEEIESAIRKVVKGEELAAEDMSPMDVLLDVDDEAHQQFAMLSIQRAMRSNSSAAAVGLHRAARKIWLADGVFGTDGMAVDDEMNELKAIFDTDLEEVAGKLREAEDMAEKKLSGENDEEEEQSTDDSEDEEEEPKYSVTEVAFDLDQFVAQYSKREVLQWYVFLLNEYRTNSTELNKALLKMLHRVAFDLKMTSRLYQLSLFHVFDQVNQYFKNLPKDAHKSSPFYDLYVFGFHVLKKFFFAFSQTGDKLALEVLFWKDAKTCYEIDHGYGSYDKDKDSESRIWTEELEAELKNLYDEYRDSEERPADIDIIDFIETNLSRQRTRRQIYRKLKDLGLDVLGAKSKKGGGPDSDFPIGDAKRIHEEWKARDDRDKVDLVNLIREKLEPEYGDFSRGKVIKQLAFVDILYEKPIKEKSLPKWPESLVTELEALKAEYEDIDHAEELLGKNIVQYVMKKLSEKKPISQVERYLESLGAVVPERKKKEDKTDKINRLVKPKKQKPIIDDGETSDEDAVNKEHGSDKSTTGDIVRSSSEEPVQGTSKAEKKGEDKEAQVVDKTEKKTLLGLIATKKRKFAQLFDSDNEDDSDDEIILPKRQKSEEGDDAPETRQSPDIDSPVVRTIKRVIVSSDEEDD